MIARVVWLSLVALAALVVGAELARLERVEADCAVQAEMDAQLYEAAVELARLNEEGLAWCGDALRAHAEMHEACSCWIAWEVQP